ncbi:hypothetical protein LCL61_28800 [Amycolatopsis coloradensis]|uniref:Uncharacterized protein n=1 Tax=Amycolatopsis coloradensis TaxID=76021 RepID=A0ACD5BJJ2_9PSEU
MTAVLTVEKYAEQTAEQILRLHGYAVDDVQALARSQECFAVRTQSRRIALADGLEYRSWCVELGQDSFTNVFQLAVDLRANDVQAISSDRGFPLRARLDGARRLAAVSGSFSFSSDDKGYQPIEPCLDLCCREGRLVSLSTATKPGLIDLADGLFLGPVPAVGTLTVDGRPFTWSGSKDGHRQGTVPANTLTVFGPANCRVDYAAAARTGFVRYVDRAGNVTPLRHAAVDYTVGWRDGDLVITGRRQGGGADLFGSAFVLRAGLASDPRFRVGARVLVRSVGGHSVKAMRSAVSIGPNAYDATREGAHGYDESLGVSPFRPVRYARTLVHQDGGRLCFRVFDGAPLTHVFRGVTPAEVVGLYERDGIDPARVYHLDGGQSSKMVFNRAGAITVAGSLHYLRWPRHASQPFTWHGIDGRELNSCFLVSARPA